jgi:hypothetical protein
MSDFDTQITKVLRDSTVPLEATDLARLTGQHSR